MTDAELQAARRRLGLSLRELATALGRGEGAHRKLRRYEAGAEPVPDETARQVEALLAAAEAPAALAQPR